MLILACFWISTFIDQALGARLAAKGDRKTSVKWTSHERETGSSGPLITQLDIARQYRPDEKAERLQGSGDAVEVDIRSRAGPLPKRDVKWVKQAEYSGKTFFDGWVIVRVELMRAGTFSLHLVSLHLVLFRDRTVVMQEARHVP